MSHTYEFHQSPNKSLKPALRSIFENEAGSDLILRVQSTKEKDEKAQFNVHKCILAVRS